VIGLKFLKDYIVSSLKNILALEDLHLLEAAVFCAELCLHTSGGV
jgi:hypothetical protein